jgi:hypothetical protein
VLFVPLAAAGRADPGAGAPQRENMTDIRDIIIGDDQADLRRRQVPPLQGVRSGLADLLDREAELAEHAVGLAWPLLSAQVLGPRNEPATTLLQFGVAAAGGRDWIGGGGRYASGPVGPTPAGKT